MKKAKVYLCPIINKVYTEEIEYEDGHKLVFRAYINPDKTHSKDDVGICACGYSKFYYRYKNMIEYDFVVEITDRMTHSECEQAVLNEELKEQMCEVLK